MRESRLPTRALSSFEFEPLLDTLRGGKAADGAGTRHYF
jgi:hypothetical protein